MARPKIGDVIEIVTRQGLRYAQFIHKHPRYSQLIRAIEGTHPSRPRDLGALAGGQTKFVTFFPLGSAVHQGLVTIVGNQPIPSELQTFPLFRAPVNRDPRTGVGFNWWLWDGEKEWPVGDLTPEQWKLPLRGIWNYTYLIEKLEAVWSAENNSI